MAADASSEARFELRLTGLGSQETMLGMNTFFSNFVLGARLHQLPDGKQWAQLWVKDQDEIARCLEKSGIFAQSGIAIEQVHTLPPSRSDPLPTSLPPLSQWPELPTRTSTPGPPSLQSSINPRHPRPSHRTTSDILSYHRPEDEEIDRYEALLHQPESSLPWMTREKGGRGFGGGSSGGALPRNLYVVDLPLDMSEIEFRNMFEAHGKVEHCKLLSQLDGMGRRRGFILMSEHREAVEAMRRTDGFIIDRCKMDVSWALVQREAKQFVPSYGAMPNRVLHPPHTPSYRHSGSDATVLLEGLDITLFPSSAAIQDLFSTFGKVLEVQVVDKAHNTVSAVVRFEHPSSAMVLAESNGMPLGDSIIKVRQVSEPTPPQRLYNQDRLLHLRPPSFHRTDTSISSDPFAFNINHIRPHQISPSSLKANVQPFVPSTYTDPLGPHPFSFQRDFANPVPKPISMRRGSADDRSLHGQAVTDDAHLAISVEQLLIGDSLQCEASESEQSSGSNSHSRSKNTSSDDSNSRTPPSSPHQPEADSGSSSDSEGSKKVESVDGKSDTVVGDSTVVGSKAERWSVGNPAAQWISTAWSVGASGTPQFKT